MTQTPSNTTSLHEFTGLTAAKAAEQLVKDGPNTLPRDEKRNLRTIVRDTLQEPMFMLLLAAGSLYLMLGDLQEGLILFFLVLVVLALTLYQEGKTERAMAALRDLSSPRALVLRDAVQQRIAGTDVVSGDLLVLAEGDRVAADAVLIDGNEIQVDESLLTGEAIPVTKVAQSHSELPTAPTVAPRPGGDGHAYLFAGTLLVSGHGLARVTATGARSEIGRIGAALETLNNERSPLKKQTAKLINVLALTALTASLLLVLIVGLRQGDWMVALLAGIALAMSLLPEEFTVVLTVLPALGAWRLSRENVLTRRIAAIETLGAISVLCVDKTGTLTENRMTVSQLVVPSSNGTEMQSLTLDNAVKMELPEAFHTLVEYSILASVAEPFDPMEKAFHRLGQQCLLNTEHLHRDWTLVHAYGLTPQLRAMSHVWRAPQGNVSDASQATYEVAAKGAPEAIVDLCHLDASARKRVAAAVDQMAAQGLRVLGVAQARFVGQEWPVGEHDFVFEFIGLLGLSDPLRAEIPEAIAQCHTAGIRIVMITGDYPATARAIGQAAGLNISSEQQVLTGEIMADLTDAELQARMKTVSVCARIAPEQKLRIVQALKANGEIVAMTGDGVNDAPALKAAHVGVAMGGRGTDVAREAASLVLLDDNFASIVRAIRMGRRIFDNLRNSMSYILALHVPIAGLALLPVLFGWPILLFPLHIAFLELVIDPACSLVFENEPAGAHVMRVPPRNANAPLFAGMTLAIALVQGVGVLLIVIGAYIWSATWLSESGSRAFTFTTLVIGNLALILSNRARTTSLWASLWVPNRTLWIVVAATLVLLGLALYQPWLARLFYFSSLSMMDLLTATGLGLFSVLWAEAIKQMPRSSGQNSAMTLTELKYIIAVARERHFGKAAEACFVSQSTLSLAVKKLEEELELKIFERSANEVTVTPLGEEVVRQAQAVLEQAAQIKAIAKRGKDPLAGALKLGVIYTIAPYLLPQLVKHIITHTPQMPLMLQENFTVKLLEMLRTGEIDCAILAEPFPDAGLAIAPLYDEPFMAALPRHHALAKQTSVTAQQMKDETLLLLGTGHCFRDHVLEVCPEFARFSSHAEGIRKSFEGSSLETIKHMVAAGMGVTLVPSLSVPQPVLKSSRSKTDEPFITYLPIADEAGGAPPTRRVVLAWRRSFTRYEAVAALRNAVYACELPGVKRLSRKM